MLSYIIALLLFAAIIYMIIASISSITKGVLPERIMKIIFGKGNYATDAKTAKIIGGLMLSPLLMFAIAIIILSTMGEKIGGPVSSLSCIWTFIVFLIIGVWSRWFNKTVNQENKNQVEKKDNGQET